MGSILYNLTAFAIFLLDIWAIIHVVRSQADTLKKVLWVALIAFPPGARLDHLGANRPTC